MSISRTMALLALIVAASGARSPTDAATLSLVGPSTKVCQLTGELDWFTNQPTAAQTMTNFGLDGVDLGFPVDSGSGPLYFLFGDTWPTKHPPSDPRPPDDSLGWTTRTATPDSSTCLGLQLATAAPQTWAPPVVSPSILQGTFNVPTGGVFLNNRLYAFFWTAHCVFRGVLPPVHSSPPQVVPQSPLGLPPGNRLCPETPALNSLGGSVLAVATPEQPVAFHAAPGRPLGRLPPTIAPMPSGFIYVSAAGTVATANGKTGIPVFGVARYRASIPYLALAPADTFSDPATWSFFAGRDQAGLPIWVTLKQWESGHTVATGGWLPPPGAEIYSARERCVGEHSVTWNAPLNSWIMLYACIGTAAESRIEARSAPEPWGPWSAPIVVLSTQDPGVHCRLIMLDKQGCYPLRDYWKKIRPNIGGFFYAPFVMNRFTVDATGGGQTKQATIYWLVSTFNPYNVVVMQSTLQLQ